MRIRGAAIAVAVAAATLTGCYGSTEFVTKLDASSATLNGRGTTNDGPAEVYFEYWKTSTPGARHTTPAKRIPGGVTGPFSEPVAGLERDTSYSYRLCGADIGEPATCAQTRSFVTGRSSLRATGDVVVPYGENGWLDLDFTAIAAPAGETPEGRAYAVIYNAEAGPPGGIQLPIGSRQKPNITCVVISGNRAVVGFRQEPPFPSDIPVQDQHYAYLLDGGPGNSGDSFSASTYFKPTPPPADCPAFPDPASLKPLTEGDIEIRDPGSAPTR